MVSLENKVIFIAWASLNGCLHLLRVNVMFISDSIAFLFWVKSQKHMLLNNAGFARLAGILHRKPEFGCEIILSLSFSVILEVNQSLNAQMFGICLHSSVCLRLVLFRASSLCLSFGETELPTVAAVCH